jgi:hypothetical protein
MIIRKIKTHITAEVPIVDNEISNNISTENGSWEYEKGDIICCAIFYGNDVTIILREKEEDVDEYKKELKNLLDNFPTLYAFNYNFEKGTFKGFLDKSYWIEEIKPWKGKGWSKQKFYEELIKDKKISSQDIPKDPLEGDSGEILNKYAENDYESIITHNIADVVKQYYIWKYKHYLLKKYEDNIDKNGWFVE